MNIPKGNQAVMPYLILKDAAGFIDFTAKVFHAQLMNKHLREDNQTVMHAEVKYQWKCDHVCRSYRTISCSNCQFVRVC